MVSVVSCMGTEKTSAIDKNTEAQRPRSFASRLFSVISVPLCFKSFFVWGMSLAGLESEKGNAKS